MSEEEKKPFTVTYTSDTSASTGTVSFECACGTPLTITRYSPESILSGVFCQTCGEQWSIKWSNGVLRRGKIGDA